MFDVTIDVSKVTKSDRVSFAVRYAAEKVSSKQFWTVGDFMEAASAQDLELLCISGDAFNSHGENFLRRTDGLEIPNLLCKKFHLADFKILLDVLSVGEGITSNRGGERSEKVRPFLFTIFCMASMWAKVKHSLIVDYKQLSLDSSFLRKNFAKIIQINPEILSDQEKREEATVVITSIVSMLDGTRDLWLADAGEAPLGATSIQEATQPPRGMKDIEAAMKKLLKK